VFSFATKAVFGVAAPLLCFGLLVFAIQDLVSWPLAFYVAVCVASFVASWIRAPRDDSLDAALRGAMFGAVLFAVPWALVMVPLTLVVACLTQGELGSIGVVLSMLGACAPIGFVVYYRAYSARWVRRRALRDRPKAQCVGFFVPLLACGALWAGLGAYARSVEQAVVARPLEADLVRLRIWRLLAPSHSWSGIAGAYHESSREPERRALQAAHVELTGRSVPYGTWD
jgi:hypothetical protein